MPQGAISFLNESDRLAKLKMDSDIRFQAGNMMQFRNLAKPIKAFGKHKGSSVEIEKYQKLSKATSTISELQSLPMNKPNVGFVQATVSEYGNGVSYTKKSQTLAEYSVDETLKKILAKDFPDAGRKRGAIMRYIKHFTKDPGEEVGRKLYNELCSQRNQR